MRFGEENDGGRGRGGEGMEGERMGGGLETDKQKKTEGKKIPTTF